MIYLHVWLKVREASEIDRIRELLAQQGRLSRAEPGCLRFEVYQSQNDAYRFLLCERWESQAALDLHRKAAAYTTIYQPQVLPHVEREPHPSTLVE
jgi:quinol monooxygenase YgiN